MWRPPVIIKNEWVVSTVEASIGNQIYQQGGDLKWGTVGGTLENKTLYGNAVEATMKDGHTLKIDLDLERDISGPNPEVDVDFELDFRCEEGIIIIGVNNIVTGTDGVGDVQSFIRNDVVKLVVIGIGVVSLVSGSSILTSMALIPLIPLFAFNMNIDPSKPELSMSCSKTLVQPNGDILLR